MPVSGPSQAVAVAQADDSEPVRFDPSQPKPMLVPLSEEAREQLLRRPPWQAAIDLQVGYVYSTRLLANEGTELRFGRSGAHGMVLLGKSIRWRCCPPWGRGSAGLGCGRRWCCRFGPTSRM